MSKVLKNGVRVGSTVVEQDKNGALPFDRVLISAATTATLDGKHEAFVGTGVACALTFPPVAGNTGRRIMVKNRGTGSITATAAGSDHFFDTASATTVVIATLKSREFMCDGAFWLALTTN